MGNWHVSALLVIQIHLTQYTQINYKSILKLLIQWSLWSLQMFRAKEEIEKKIPFFVTFYIFCQSWAHSTSMKLATEEIGHFHLFISIYFKHYLSI